MKLFDEALMREHYRFLAHEHSTEIRVIPVKGRNSEAMRVCDETGGRLPGANATYWANNEDQFVYVMRSFTKYGGGDRRLPYQFYVVIRDAIYREGFSANELRIVSVRTLFLDVEPVRPPGTAAKEPERQRCLELCRGIADWSEEMGWKRPLLVDSGNGVHVYFAIPEIRINDDNRSEIKSKIRGFEEFVRSKFKDDADRNGIKIDTVSSLSHLMKIWGTPSVKGLDRSCDRLCRPLGASAPHREKEDENLRRWLLELDVRTKIASKARKKTERFAKETKSINANALEWPDSDIRDIDPEALGEVPSINQEHPLVAGFFEGLSDQWERAGQDRSRFLIRVLRVLLALYAKEKGIAPDRAAKALFNDKEAMRRVFKQWQKINLDFCIDDDGQYKGAGRVHLYFTAYVLGYLNAHPENINWIFEQREARQPRRVERSFTPRTVSWEERRAAMADWMRQRLITRGPGIYVNNAEPSVSKTGTALKLVRDLLEVEPQSRFLYLAYSHELLAEIRERAIAAGIPADDTFIVKGLQELCTYEGEGGKDAVLEAARKHLSVQRSFCDKCEKKPTCPWHTQKEAAREARFMLAPSAYIAQQGRAFGRFLEAEVWGNDRRDAIFIDEDATSYLGVRRDFTPSGLREYREALRWWEESLGSRNRYFQALTALTEFLLAFSEDPFKPGAIARYSERHVFNLDERWQARKMLQGSFTDESFDYTLALEAVLRWKTLLIQEVRSEGPAVEWDLPDEQLTGGARAETSPGTPSDTDGGEFDSPESGGSEVVFYKDQKGIVYTFLGTLALPDRPVFILDGTANTTYYQRAFRSRRVEFFLPDLSSEERTYIKPEGRILQIVDASNSRKKLREDGAIAGLCDAIRVFVQRRREEDPERRFLLITYADSKGGNGRFESRFSEILADLGDVLSVRHFGGVRGLDEFNGEDVMVVGSFLLPSVGYADEVRSVLGHEPANWDREHIEVVLPSSVESSYAVDFLPYQDPWMQAVYVQKTLGEQNQAIARSRIFLPQNVASTVVVFNNAPLPGLLVEPMRLHDFLEAYGKERPARYARGAAHAQANEPLRRAVAKILADSYDLTAREVLERLERDYPELPSVGKSRIPQIWDADDVVRLVEELQRERAKKQIEKDLRAQGVSDEREIASTIREFTELSRQLLPGGNEVWTGFGWRELQGTGITRRAWQKAKAQVRSWKEQAATEKKELRRAKGEKPPEQ